MKIVTKLLIIFFILPAQGGEPIVISDLSSLQWKNRVVLVNDAQQEERILAVFRGSTPQIDDRDTLWFLINGDQVITNYSGNLAEDFRANVRDEYRLGKGEVVLIGKDGGVKTRSNRLDLDALLSDIDAMPMRRSEIDQ